MPKKRHTVEQIIGNTIRHGAREIFDTAARGWRNRYRMSPARRSKNLVTTGIPTQIVVPGNMRVSSGPEGCSISRQRLRIKSSGS